MKKKYKLLLLLSNIFLIIFVLNIFAKFIVFQNSWINAVLIFLFCIMNVVIALKASFEAAENK